jgi:hypothetical protein
VLTSFDDLPLHQSPQPIAYAGSSDRNAYERYFFNGHDRDGEVFFAVALGVYPNREVIDAAFSVVRDGTQRSLHASARLGPDRVRTAVGPIEVVVDRPLRVLRVLVDAPELGFDASLTFRARTPAVQEPRFQRMNEGRIVFDYLRLTQWGAWEGTLAVDGETQRVDPEHHRGCRDRSWGVRPVGESPGGAPSHSLPQFFWLWAPISFDDCCTHFDVNEDGDGGRWHQTGMVVPLLDERAEPSSAPHDDGTGIAHAAAVGYEIEWLAGTRRAKRASVSLGGLAELDLEPILTFPMRGLGYVSPDWNHGAWKGEYHVGTEAWRVDDLDPCEPWNLHVQQLVRARWGDREGSGVLEVLALNEHAPTGLTGLVDGASA